MDPTTELFPVTSDEVGLVLHRPRRKLIQIVVASSLALVVTAGGVGWIAASYAFQRSSQHTDMRIGVLEKDLAERRQAAVEANARRDEQLARVAQLVCTVFDRLQPRDAEVEAIRAQYHCTGNPVATTSPAPAIPVAPRSCTSCSSPPRSVVRVTPAPTPAPAPKRVVPQPGPVVAETPQADQPTPLLCLLGITCFG